MAEREADEACEEFFSFAHGVIDAGRLRLEAQFVQHGTTSTLLHSLAVAAFADARARSLGYTAHLDEVRRAALLHDYYLYDWHAGTPECAGHALRHAGRAAANALRDYPDLTAREYDAIRCHMFPINPTPPRYGVGWLVTWADKVCAARETLVREGVAYPQLRVLAARYMPDVELGVVPEGSVRLAAPAWGAGEAL